MIKKSSRKRNWKRRIVAALVVACGVVIFPTRIKAQDVHPTSNILHPSRVLFVSQVRGGECCDAGSFEHLQRQVETLQERNLPATFTIRYDALIDKTYTTYFQEVLTSNVLHPTSQIQLGVFLEITPSLASASGVEYTGSADDWYEAQHAYPIGYSQEERRKLIDTVMEQFRSVFGEYPSITTGWIVDTFSINYLRDRYGVTTHQITREQWGTDSYTLSGGPIHYPYLADDDWSFLPADVPTDQQQADNRDTMQQSTLILRQTVSDPLFNYGDMTSAFTSQPNDYARDGKNIEYFKKLIAGMLGQTHNPYSIAILGLENSMAQEYQQDFAQQIEHIASLRRANPDLVVQTVQEFEEEFRERWSREAVSVVIGDDIIHASSEISPRAIWIITPLYRARFLVKENKLLLTDYRLYDVHPTSYIQIQDIYSTYKAQNLGYWVTPFVLDSSRFYIQTPTNTSLQNKIKDAIKAVILPEYRFRETPFLPTANDTTITPQAVQIADLADHSLHTRRNETDGSIVLNFTAVDGSLVSLIAHARSVIVESPTAQTSITYPEASSQLPTKWEDRGDHKSLLWSNESGAFGLTITCGSVNRCELTPRWDDGLDLTKLQQSLYPFFFPEVTQRPLSNTRTTLYAHNQYAIAGQNPVRFVLIPKDEHGYGVQTQLEPIIHVDPPVKDISIQSQQGTNGIIFIDLIDNRAGKYVVALSLGDQISQQRTVYFVPNCKTQLRQCVSHPLQAWRYIRSMLTTKLREL